MVDPNLSIVYQQVCTSYHAIDDFRTKLLGFLPLATGTGFLVLFSDKVKMDLAAPLLLPFGIFGFLVTIGLFLYELHGIKKCDHLIKVGGRIEQAMLSESPNYEGQFKSRPHEVEFLRFKIFEKSAACVIYSAVLSAWSFVAFVGVYFHPVRLVSLAALVFVVAVVISYRLKTEVENA